MKLARFSDADLEEVLRRTDLVKLVGRRVKLARKGRVFWGCCPFHKDNTPSFKVENARRRYHCFGCGAGGDAFRWLQETEGLNFPEAVRQLAGGEISPQPSEEPQREEPGPRAEPAPDPRALRLWLRARPIGGTIADHYLRKERGITVEIPPTLRFGSAWSNAAGAELPALIAAIARPTDRRVVAVQATYLTEDGRKVPFKPARQTFGATGTGAIRLAAASDHLGISEGVEKALAAMQLSGVPCWSSVGGWRLATITIPETVRVLHIFGDNDTTGRERAERAADRFTREGRKVYLRFPPEGFKDYDQITRARAGTVAA